MKPFHIISMRLNIGSFFIRNRFIRNIVLDSQQFKKHIELQGEN